MRFPDCTSEIIILSLIVNVFPDGTATSSANGNGSAGSASNASGNGPVSSGGSSRLGVREMMQQAVTAARSASSSLAGLDVEEDAPIPTLHWPPDGQGDLSLIFSSLVKIINSKSPDEPLNWLPVDCCPWIQL